LSAGKRNDVNLGKGRNGMILGGKRNDMNFAL
jgi:hypothetical protein